MEFNAKMINGANALVEATILMKTIENKVEKIAAEAAKTLTIQGFRKGKVPVSIVKKRYGDKLKQDAESEILKDLLQKAYKELNITAERLIGEPFFKKFERNDNEIKLEIALGLRPEVELSGYEESIPKYEKPDVKEEEVDARIKEMALRYAEFKKVEKARPLAEGDTAVIDFEGFLDGKPFEGGKAEKFSLTIGSGQFVPGFEEQLVGMNEGEEKTIKVTFPKDYGSKKLAGKEAEFKVKLYEIQERIEPEINDELAQKIMQKEGATLDELKENVKTQIINEKLSKKYQDDLKPKLMEALLKRFDFDLPEQIVEQEIDIQLSNKARSMKEEELKELQGNKEKIKKMREELRDSATESVKATFIVDMLAKKEKISVEDKEVAQAIYYEAMMQGQNPQKMIEQYQKQGYLPAIKMAMIEDKLFTKMLKLYE